MKHLLCHVFFNILIASIILVVVSCSSPKLSLDDAPKIFDFSANFPGALSQEFDYRAKSELLGESSKVIIRQGKSNEIWPIMNITCAMWIVDDATARKVSPNDLLLEFGYTTGVQFIYSDDDSIIAYYDIQTSGSQAIGPGGDYGAPYTDLVAMKHANVFVLMQREYSLQHDGESLQILAAEVSSRIGLLVGP